MAPHRRNIDNVLARINFPLFSVQMLTNRHVLVAGGGGSAKTGVANGFVGILTLKFVLLYQLSCRRFLSCPMMAESFMWRK